MCIHLTFTLFFFNQKKTDAGAFLGTVLFSSPQQQHHIQKNTVFSFLFAFFSSSSHFVTVKKFFFVLLSSRFIVVVGVGNKMFGSWQLSDSFLFPLSGEIWDVRFAVVSLFSHFVCFRHKYTVRQVILATKKVANCKKTPKIRQYFLVAKLFGGKAVFIGTKKTSTKKVPLQCTRCSVS